MFNEQDIPSRMRPSASTQGWRCWEAGAGGAIVPSWLCERVGPTGRVLASDVSTAALDEVTDPPYQVLRHDLTVDPPPATEFDLVHTRLVLEHLKAPAVALTTLVGRASPGRLAVGGRRRSGVAAAAPAPTKSGRVEALANKVRLSFWDVLGQRRPPRIGKDTAPTAACRRPDRRGRRGSVEPGRAGCPPPAGAA